MNNSTLNRFCRRDGLVSLIICAGFLFFGCGSKKPRENSKDKPQARVRLNYSNIDQPKRLDPAFVKDLYEGIVSGFIYDGLVVFGKGTDVEPGLAERWEVSPDGRTYTFHLRNDAKFADGRPLTAADVRYSFTRILRPETESDRKWVLNRIEGADELSSGTARELRGLATPDEHTVIITLRDPYPVFLKMLAMPNAVIIPVDSAGTEKPAPAFDRKPLGSGPWELVEWLDDQRLRFRRNEHFWGEKPEFRELVYHVQVDENVRRKLFEIGQHDFYQVGFAVYDSWMRDERTRTLTTAVQELRTEFFGFMNDKPKWQDKRVRQAISHGINTRAIFESLQKSRGVMAHGPIPPGVEAYRADLPQRKYDPDKARELLAQAGASNLTIEFWYRDDALSGEMVQAARQDLAKIGVTVTPMARDLVSLRAGVHNGEPDMYVGNWTLDYPDAENAVVPTFHSRNIPRQGNGSHFRSPTVDRLLEEAEREPDGAQRIVKFHRAEDAIMEECPWVFLFHRKTYYAVQPWVRGWMPAVMYNADRFNELDLQ